MKARKPRPILRYHGGKWLLAPWIISHFPEHRIYVEPFGGAASVLLQKKRSYAEVYNDLDGEIVNLFRVVRDRGEELRGLLYLTPYSRDDYKLSFEQSTDPVEQARRTVIRSFMGFGSNALNRNIKSGFRSNSNRSGTTPAHDWTNYPDKLEFIIERLKGVIIENRPAVELIQPHDSEKTLFYLDPPYLPETRSTNTDTKGYTHEMTTEDHIILADAIKNIQGYVVLSGYDNELYRDLYQGWTQITRKALADGARPREECLWISPNTPIPQMDLFHA